MPYPRLEVKAFVRTYGFLAAILPYTSAEWEKRSIFLNLLIPKLPAPIDDDLAQGILETIDIESYRVEARAALALALPDEDGSLDPVPTGTPGQNPDPELDRLSAIVQQFNELFGNYDWKDGDKVLRLITQEIPATVAANPAYQHAIAQAAPKTPASSWRRPSTKPSSTSSPTTRISTSASPTSPPSSAGSPTTSSPRPYDPARPVVCLDETSRQLLGEARSPRPPAPGRPARHDPKYVRGGVLNFFLATEPLRGWREVLASERRTRLGFAACVRHLADVRYPAAERIVLVTDQINTHSLASLYAAFPAAEAKRLAAKVELHHTPKHGSWLNIAEIELAVLQRQCLRQRLPDRRTAERQVSAWAARRNEAGAAVDWQFTTADARTKLKRLYPAVHA